MNNTPAQQPTPQRYTPIRRRLIYHVMAVIGVIAILILPVELYRPIIQLNQLIENSKALIAGVNAALDRDELARMHRFALNTIKTQADEPEMEPYLFLSFTMLITERTLPSADQIQSRMSEAGSELDDFDYRLLQRAADYWLQRFDEDPGIREIFVRNKKTLITAKKQIKEEGFNIADIYLMLDSGNREGVFTEHLAFVLDGYQWWEENEPAYPGELYHEDVNPNWRSLALAGLSGFDHDPKHDRRNFLLPRFTIDEWGTWFSVWWTEKVDDHYTIITIDFEASSVTATLVTVLFFVLGFFFVALALVISVATALSNTFTRPITELTKGSQELAAGNYDYVVPVHSHDELGELTRNFNTMAQGQKERLNLKSTLEKLLSKELAEIAGRQGLVLGGKRSDATMFFTDFAGFSTISQQMTPSEAVAMLNIYFEALIPIIKRHGGFPDKYIGDAIVAIFGAPIYFEDHADRALRCAIEMQRTLRKLNSKRIKNKEPVFEMRIGMNSGDVIVGAIGCDMKLEYTSIGETTNLANRMESACEVGHIMLARGTYWRLDRSRLHDVVLDDKPLSINVKGYDEPVDAYRVFIDKLRISKREGGQANRFYRYAVVEERDHKIRI